MRRWIWLAVTAMLAVTQPAMAETGPGNAPAKVSDDEMAVRSGLQDAIVELDIRDAKGAEADLAALVAGTSFPKASAATQARVLYMLGVCENINQEPEAAFAHLSDAGRLDPSIRNQFYWLEVARVDYKLDKAADIGDALTGAIAAEPDMADNISPGLLYEMLRRMETLKDGGAHRRPVLEALWKINYDPAGDPTAAESLRVDLFEIYADAGEDAKARTLLPTFGDPDTVIALRADNRYRKYILDDPDFSDFKAVQDRHITALHTRQASGGLPYAEALAQALQHANRLPEALKVVDDALLLGDLAPNTGGDDKTKWLLDTRTRILALMGRWDEVEAAQIKARDTALLEGVDLVSQKLNLADLYNRLGRPQDALTELTDLSSDKASIYGQMTAEQVRACAYAAMGDKAKLEAALATLRSHSGEAAGPLASALVCADDEDGLATLIIARLDDPDQRVSELLTDQAYLPAPHPTAADALYASRMSKVLKRPDVQAAIARYGVVESYPAFAPDN